MTNHVWIRDENNNRKIQWQPWAYLIDLLDILCTYQEVDINKARQLGITWTVVGFGLWKAHFNEIGKNLYLSQGETEAWELISKSQFIWEHLPDYMRKPLDNDTRSWISFKGTHSEMRALPSTKRAGSGYNATVVIRDELYNHPEGEDNFGCIAPAIDAGGQMVNLSAVYGEDMSNHFVVRVSDFFSNRETVKTVYPSGLELYTNPDFPSRALVFLGWKLRPTRLEGMTLDEFYDSRLRPRYTQKQLDRQYPKNIEDTLRISPTSNFFEIAALDDMGYDVCPPARSDKEGVAYGINTYNGIVRVYKPPIVGRKYVVFTDPSDGRVDPFVTGVMDFVTGEVVCSATGMERIGKVAEIHNYLTRQYNKATNSFEYMATVGGEFWKMLQDLNTPGQSPRRKVDGRVDIGKKGQVISPEHKLKIISELASGIASRGIICHDREFSQQAKMVTRDKSRDGLKEIVGTDRNLSFDWVMMMAGLWQLQKYAPRGEFKIEVSKYRD